MNDLINGIKAQLYDRLSSPLLFTFAFSLLAWNYRAVLIFLSSLTPSDKFLALDLLSLSWNNETFYWPSHLIFFPLATSAIYIFALPWVEKIVFEYSLMRKRDLKISRQKIEDKTPVSTEEARELRSLGEVAYKEYDAVIKSRQEEIARLKIEVDDLKEKLKSLSPSSTNADTHSKDLQESQIALLRKIDEFGGDNISKNSIFKRVSVPRLKIQYDIDELVRRDFISEHDADDDDNDTTYSAVSLTVAGRRFLIENLSADLI
ncbi:hypothetical protein ACL9RI_17215 [Janthinobacterium sp. Mn2066]|uniref:hypothetical protein n=1 Tax=Janthinobacterium sp. Mn2066 TaxID=3395264 RepID=UPI003BE784F6